MGVDYGVRPARRVPWLWVHGTILGLALIGWLVGKELWERRVEAIATAREWTIDGPPCPTVTAAGFAAGKHRLRQSFTYGGMTFARAAGHVSCASVVPKGGRALMGAYPVCQFTSPAVVRLTTPKGEYFFVPGIGRPATVSAPGGVGRCVLASKFTLN